MWWFIYYLNPRLTWIYCFSTLWFVASLFVHGAQASGVDPRGYEVGHAMFVAWGLLVFVTLWALASSKLLRKTKVTDARLYEQIPGFGGQLAAGIVGTVAPLITRVFFGEHVIAAFPGLLISAFTLVVLWGGLFLVLPSGVRWSRAQQ